MLRYLKCNTEAHNSPTPVYISQKAELVAMMNPKAYEVLKTKCDAVMLSRSKRKLKTLPLFVLHPASR